MTELTWMHFAILSKVIFTAYVRYIDSFLNCFFGFAFYSIN